MTSRPRRVLALTAAVALSASIALAQPRIPTPEQFFGFPMGAERKLAGWDRIVEYFETVDRLSDRVVVQELGKTTMGRPFIAAFISSPENLQRSRQLIEIQSKLAELRLNPDEAMHWYRRARLVIADPATREVAPSIAHHPDALAVWEYLDRSIDPSIVSRAFELRD